MTIEDYSIDKRNVGEISLNKDYSEIARECMKLIECDTARIVSPQNKMYLIIGFNKNTKDDPGQWIDQKGERRDFKYIQEQVIASGITSEELLNSVREYNRLKKISWEEYLKEIANK
jgi:hypothetical protein